MRENKSLTIVKENFLTKIFNKIKNMFKRNKNQREECRKEKADHTTNIKLDNNKQKNEFPKSLKVQEDTSIIYLKIKLENNEIKAIDLTDKQIDELQQIYDREIQEKQNKIKKLKEIA